ncbi:MULTISPECIES: EAL domain-containing protein [unclassified Pseudoalteromonas]|uniref:sensor domain-containing protein n=1 Tax=unclassified Pseudoalteromonas TaxID=194690 RepID=UPI00073161BB|nr:MULTISPECIES: EAL domain-containing protein [unclassified Pseudoalteromonas]KTD91778.1 hypothetical protein ATS71_05770 [Pseudoalteromonas sp. H71]MBW4966042.1 EAL domain-containing protein [Pseudoalteromonas sp. CR1]TMN84576.1 bifunctional diguanylate cyclase/phosphodiesterase [Pseudoalteromonas sp. S410]TMN91207.1 bifunctional diguanylate cyclase/phosphodiesterase [Pseudoalteromonas sp. S408]TMN98086.1 bifunctional diguanylate cyclase/phosphodiesterase [Pseudoalteromonas sp. S407]|tara:strand:+ start:1872 stop:3578 length:1707 start_codon:yes stop_codon:yes gene_type:complete
MTIQFDQFTTLHEQLTGIISAIPFGVVVLSDSHEIEIINASATQFLGLTSQSPSDVIDQNYKDSFMNIPVLVDKYENLIVAGKRRKFALPCDSEQHNLNIYVTCQKMLKGTLFIIEDRTETKALIHKTSHDHLTQLLNRQSFEKILETTYQKSNINDNAVVVFIDLDRFKLINDIAGHAYGDEVLKRVATSLVSCVRDSDDIARIGGDEFALLIRNCSLNRAKDIVHVILQKVENINLISSGKVLGVSLSAGIAPIDPSKYDNVSQVINAADTACRLAKGDNEERIHIIDSYYGEFESYLQDTNLLNTINFAIANNSFYLVAQEISPLVCNSEHQHYEILLRLKSEDGTNIPPNLFIPVAERARIMAKIDRWVIAETFSKINSKVNVSINLSGQSLSDMTLAEFIICMSHRYQVNPKQVTFEITETAVISNIEKTQNFISSLKENGYTFSLDDFGTGLSSYQYLKSLRVDYIKIDGMFVKDINDDSFSHAMVCSINDFAHKIGLKTVAEFASSNDIVEELKKMKVDFAQGFFIHKPQLLAELINEIQLRPKGFYEVSSNPKASANNGL